MRRSQDLKSAARGALSHAGIERVLALPKAGPISYPDAPRWPVFLSELMRSLRCFEDFLEVPLEEVAAGPVGPVFRQVDDTARPSVELIAAAEVVT